MTANAPHLHVVHDDGRTPPNDVDAEGAVLSAILIDPTALGVVRDILRPEHFYYEPNRRIYEAAADLHLDGKPVDVVTVGTRLRERGRLMQTGGMAYLTSVLNAAPSIAIPKVRAYAEAVYDFWRTREVISTAQRIAAEGYLDHGPTQPWVDGAARALAELASKGIDGGAETTIEAIRRILAQIMVKDASAFRDKMGIRTGIRELDDLTLGLHGKQMTVLAALPGRGKTTCALQIAAHVASQGLEVLFFSVDQVRDELVMKLLSSRARVDGKRLMGGMLTKTEWDRVVAAIPGVEAFHLRIDDTRKLHVGQIRQRAMAHRDRVMAAHKRPLGLVVVDYIQKLKPAPHLLGSTKREQVEHASEELKDMADDMQIPVLVCAQQKSSMEIDKFSKMRPRPDTNSIADSSQPGKDAHNLYFLYRAPLRRAGKVVGEDPTTIELIMTKQKVGETGDFILKFEREFSTFVSAPPTDDAPPTRFWPPAGEDDDSSNRRAGPDR
jgi:replicative DNA helicase